MSNDRLLFSLPPSLTPAAMKKLVETRNERFEAAVNESGGSATPFLRFLISRRLLIATPGTEDPVALLQAASRDHIPVNPSWRHQDDDNDPKEIPCSKDRPTIDAAITEMQEQRWYKGQIVMKKIIDEIEAREGALLQCFNCLEPDF
jgi:DEAD/DEAH box helicase domain-containing protein